MQNVSSPLLPTLEQDQRTAKAGKQLNNLSQHKGPDTHLLASAENSEGTEHPQVPEDCPR